VYRARVCVIQSSGVRQTEHKKRRPCTGRRARTRLFRRVFRLFDTRDTKSTTVYTRVHDPQTIGVYRATSTESARFSIQEAATWTRGGGESGRTSRTGHTHRPLRVAEFSIDAGRKLNHGIECASRGAVASPACSVLSRSLSIGGRRDCEETACRRS